MSEKRSLAVRIRGQEFRIRSDESPELLAEVAEIVEARKGRPSMPRLRALIERAEAAGSAVSH